jgi:Holliday junction resolvasome RuvABC endonuclease subunit
MIALQEKRVLAIDPTSRGFGFAVLEGPRKLIDWGVKQLRKEKTARSILQSKELMARYCPDVVVVEDWQGRGSRRCLRIGNLIRAIRTMAERRRISTRCFSRFRVRQAFASWHAWTKYQIAIAIARQLPELKSRLPRYRKPWMSEDERMAIFDAVAFALTYFYFAGHERRLTLSDT